MGGAVQSKRLVKRVQPVYPPLAIKARITGAVKLAAIIARDGAISQIEVISGHPLLVQPSLDAVRQWHYEPTLLNGEPVEVITTIDVIFTLEGVGEKETEEKMPRTLEAQLRARITKHMQQGKYDDALHELRAFIQKNPSDTEMRRQLATALSIVNRMPEAISELREALRLKPADLSLHQTLFRFLMDSDLAYDAMAQFHEMRRYGEPDPGAYAQLGVLLYRLQSADSAAAEIHMLAQGSRDAGQVHSKLFEGLLAAGRLDAALHHAAEAAQLNPQNVQLQEEIRRVGEFKDMLDRGMEMLRIRLQQQPARPEVRVALALGFLMQDSWETHGRDEYVAALELGFDEIEAHNPLAMVLANRNGKRATIAEFRSFAGRFPAMPNLRLTVAELLTDIGNIDGAVAELRAAIAAAPDNAALREKLADLLQQSGDAASAAAEREMARSLPPPAQPGSALRALLRELFSSIAGDELERDSIAANETSAVGAMRTLNTAAVMYSANYGGFPPSLVSFAGGPGTGAEPSAKHADLIDPQLASGTKNGYTFTYLATATGDRGEIVAYEINADPEQPGVTGNRSFFTDQSGIIRVNTGGRARSTDPPIT
ncbi:MAG: energy transducer TonB [Candidatus Acidiferrales bacterium]